MKRAALFLSAIVVLCAVLLWRGEPPAPGAPGDAQGREVVGQAVAGDQAVADEPRANGAAATTERSEVQTGTPAAPTSRITGRCVAAESGEPLAGCTARFGSGRDKQEATTAADGRFALDVVPERDGSITITRPQRATRFAWLQTPKNGRTEDLGDIAVPAGFTVRGRVTDRAGEGIPNCQVALTGFTFGIERLRPVPGHAGAGSGDDGSFELRQMIPAGTWNASCDGMSAPVQYTIDPVTGAPPLVLVLDTSTRRIRGIVVDDRGEPIKLVPLRASMPRASAMSGPDGTFTLETMAAGDGQNVVSVLDPVEHDIDDQVHVVPWGTDDLRIVLRRNRDVTVEVVDDRGEPVREFSLRLTRAANPRTNIERSARAQGVHENGIAVVKHVRRGRNVLRVTPAAPELAASAIEELFVPDDGPCHVKVVLRRLVPCPIEVVDGTGAGLAGVQVTLAEVPAAMPPLTTLPYISAKGSQLPLRYLEAISETKTDAVGKAVVHALIPASRTVLRITAKNRPEWFQETPNLAPDRTLRIVLAAGGVIEGNVDLHGEPHATTRISVQPAEADLYADQSRLLRLGGDGAFVIRGLKPGTWRVALMVDLAHSDGGAVRGIPVPVQGSERLVEVRDGATVKVQLEARPGDRGTLRGTLDIVGRDPTGWRVSIANSAHTDAARGPFVVGSDGSFVAEGLPPGRYRVLARRPAVRGGLGRMCGDEFEVAAGAVLSRTFTVQPQRLILNLQFPDALPVDRSWWLRQGASREYGSDVERIVLDPAPESGFQVTCDPAGRVWSDPVVVPPGVAEHEATVIVPRPGF